MKTLVCILVTLLAYSTTFSQGLNNDQYPFDQVDAENVASIFLGIETYKFFTNAKLDDYLDIKIMEYKEGEMVKESKAVSDMIAQFGMNPLSRKHGDNFVRFYVQNNLEKDNSVKISIKYLNLSIPKGMKDLELKYVQSRAFSDVPNNIEISTPVLAIYGNKEGEYISCPGGAAPEEIIKLYDWVSVVYLEKLEE